MKTKNVIIHTVLVCMVFSGCTKLADCASMDEYIGRVNRLPVKYNSNYFSLDEFAAHYSKVVDGDTLRLKGRLVQDGNDSWGYRLWLFSFDSNNTVGSKEIDFVTFYSQRQVLLSTESENLGDINGPVRKTPYLTEECYDTIKNTEFEFEGIIHFCRQRSPGECTEQCYLYIGDWDKWFDRIIDQQTNQQRQKEQ